MEVLLKENTELRNKLVCAMESQNETREEPKFLSGLLKDLYDMAKTNYGKKSQGWRYNNNALKELCVLLYLLGGLQVFEIFSANLPVPCVSTIKSVLISHDVVKEGHFRILELRDYLVKRNLPLEVFISEDATKITGRIMYHPGTNQLVGFVPPRDENGLPIVGSFPATSAGTMCKYFKEEHTSNFAYVLMAQPVGGKAPAFCLCLFGTDNKFKSYHVLNMWDWLLAATAKEGITIRGFASDGDSKLMHAMRYKTFVPNPKSNWEWFESDKLVHSICIQDYVHVLVKLKTRLLKPSCILPIGPKYVASAGHLLELMNNFPKEIHDLSDKVFNRRDKMNFESAAKLCSERVSDLLTEENIPCSIGTKIYIDMMRETFTACASPTIAPLERIELLWKWVIFLRIWHKWILDSDGYSVQHNFITSNAYYCLEINAHSLIQNIICNRENETPSLFKPWLYSSQPCESLFRMFRGLTSTFNTVVNFSILEMIYRLRRIDYIAEAYVNLKEKYCFPRQVRAFNPIEGEEYVCITLPEDYEIEQTVQRAFLKANELAVKLKIINKPLQQIPPSSMAVVVHKSPIESEEILEDEEIDDEVVETNEEESREEEESDSEENEMNEDIAISSSASSVKRFDNMEINPTSPFVRVRLDNGGTTVIKKSTYCWRLSCGDTKLSSDRVVKFKSRAVQHRGKITTRGIPKPIEEKYVSIGEWCAFVEDKAIVLGRIMSLSYMSGTTWSNQAFVGNTAKVASEGREVGVMCSWFSISRPSRNKAFLKEMEMDLQGFYPLKTYICTLPRPPFENGNFYVPSEVIRAIKVIAKDRVTK